MELGVKAGVREHPRPKPKDSVLGPNTSALRVRHDNHATYSACTNAMNAYATTHVPINRDMFREYTPALRPTS